MKAHALAPDLHVLHARITGNDLPLFEGIWPLTTGVTLNTYFVKGDKTALIDLVCDWDGVAVQIEDQLDARSLSVADLDYLVLNHMEPDHTSWLPYLIEKNPKIVVLCTERAAKLARAFYGEAITYRIVKTGDTLDLGRGRVLHFIETPNTHWPETMMTWEESTGALFSCDVFGGFGLVGDKLFDDQLSPADLPFVEREAARYYSNILGAFSGPILKAMDLLAQHAGPVKMVCPSHGIVWRSNPHFILDLYRRFAAAMETPTEERITVLWSSMYGNTEAVLPALLEGIASEGVEVLVHQVPQTHVSEILASAWTSRGLVLAMPTYEYRMFPPMASVIDMMGRKHVRGREVLRFGSFGWSGGAAKELEELHDRGKLKWAFVDPVEWNGKATETVLARVKEAGADLARRVKGPRPEVKTA
jgi:flavorubredoxin